MKSSAEFFRDLRVELKKGFSKEKMMADVPDLLPNGFGLNIPSVGAIVVGAVCLYKLKMNPEKLDSTMVSVVSMILAAASYYILSNLSSVIQGLLIMVVLVMMFIVPVLGVILFMAAVVYLLLVISRK